jgi:gas vesicle protein
MVMSENRGFLRGFVLGGLVGGILGVLLAPKSGRELREDLSTEADKIFAHAKSDLENARKAAMQSFEDGRNKIIEKMKPVEKEEIVVEEETTQKKDTKHKGKRDRN